MWWPRGLGGFWRRSRFAADIVDMHCCRQVRFLDAPKLLQAAIIQLVGANQFTCMYRGNFVVPRRTWAGKATTVSRQLQQQKKKGLSTVGRV
jgi:hypothetical protein